MSAVKVSSTKFMAAVSVIGVITASVVASAIIIIMIVGTGSKNGGQGDDQSQGSHGVVDCRSNIAADSNSMEGLGSVPLLS